jgi:hypothetical protein
VPIRVLVVSDRLGEPLSWPARAAWSPEWERCALELLNSRTPGGERSEVYLCLSEDEQQHLDRQAIEDLVRVAREASWDADIYLVLNSRQGLPYDPLTQFDALNGWIEAALRSGIKDLLEVWVDGLDKIDPALLRAARVRAAKRETLSRGFGQAAAWRVVVSARESPLGSFLEPFVHWQTYGTADHRLILIVDKAGAARQHSRVTQHLSRYGANIEVVAALGVPATQRLIDLCDERGLALLRFLGPHELRFFVQRLKAPDDKRSHPLLTPKVPMNTAKPLLHRSNPATPGDLRALYQPRLTSMKQSIPRQGPHYLRALTFEMRLEENLVRTEGGDTETLRADRNEIVGRLNDLCLEVLGTSFNDLGRMVPDVGEREKAGAVKMSAAASTEAVQAVLVTLALDPAAERDDCLMAARLVGLIRERKPPGAEVRIHLCRTGGSVGDMLLEMPAPKIWIYLGEAGPEGLPDTASGRFVAASGWLGSLPAGPGGLSLALLFAGRSEESARDLVYGGGVSCAMGFNGSAPLRELEPVIRAFVQEILSEGADRGSVEKAQLAARRILRARGFEESMLKTFFSEAP